MGWTRCGNSGANRPSPRLSSRHPWRCCWHLHSVVGAAPQAHPRTCPPLRRDSATVSECARLLRALPPVLDGLRGVAASEADTASWGAPTVTLRCGSTRPSELDPLAMLTLIAGPRGGAVYWLAHDSGMTFTVIDRAVYIDVTITTGIPPLPTLSDVIAEALPPGLRQLNRTRPLGRAADTAMR